MPEDPGRRRLWECVHQEESQRKLLAQILRNYGRDIRPHAEEMLQDILVKFDRKLCNDNGPIPHPEAYIRTAIEHSAIDRLRKIRTQRHAETVFAELKPQVNQPATPVLDDGLLDAAIQTLDPIDQTIVRLRMAGLSWKKRVEIVDPPWTEQKDAKWRQHFKRYILPALHKELIRESQRPVQ